MSLKAKVEAIIYAAEEPVSVDQMVNVIQETEPSVGDLAELKASVCAAVEELTAEYAQEVRGIEVRRVACGYRMSTKPEHHDAVRAFAKGLKPPVRLSLAALETLAVIAYKQPVTVPEISEIRGVDASGVIATLLDRKLITTAGRKAVIGRPILYKTTKDFLMRFGLSDIGELPSVEEFEKLGGGDAQAELFRQPVPDATGVPEVSEDPSSTQTSDENVEATSS
jgi:segregation and condensation protein B